MADDLLALPQAGRDTLALALAAIPKPAIAAPLSEKTTPATGTATSNFALQDHQHPRLTSTTMATVATGSTVTLTFTRAFTNKPGMVFTEIEGDSSAASQPAIFKVQSWTQDASNNYTGCVVKVWRAQVMPTQTTNLSLASLLTGVITGLNTLAASITGLNMFGAGVVGTQFSCIAVARSDVAST